MNDSHDQLPDAPRPDPTSESQGYWDGLRAHQLKVQRCTACGKLRHYPRPMCDACYAMDYDWQRLSGRGTLHSWTVSHHPFHPAFKRQVPYITVTVDLEEGVRLHAPLRASAAADLRVGAAVEIGYETIDADLTLPCFKLCAATPADDG